LNKFKNFVDWRVFITNKNKFINKDNFKIDDEFSTIYTKVEEDITIFVKWLFYSYFKIILFGIIIEKMGDKLWKMSYYLQTMLQ